MLRQAHPFFDATLHNTGGIGSCAIFKASLSSCGLSYCWIDVSGHVDRTRGGQLLFAGVRIDSNVVSLNCNSLYLNAETCAAISPESCRVERTFVGRFNASECVVNWVV